MKLKTTLAKLHSVGHRFSIMDGQVEVAHAYLWIMHNDLHQEPFGLMEDVDVVQELQGKGIGSTLVEQIIALAKEKGCYKLIATSRHARDRVHGLYKKLGFEDHGHEFRIDF